MKGHDTFKQAVDRLAEATLEAVAASRQARSTRSTSSSTTRPTPGSSPRSAERLGLDRRARRRLHRRARQHLRGDDPARARRGARTRACSADGDSVLLAAFGGGLTWARDRDRVGSRRADGRGGRGWLRAARSSPAPRAASAPRRRARSPRTAGRSRSTTAATPTAPASVVERDRGRRRPGARRRAPTSPIRDAVDELFEAAEDALGPVLVLVNNAGMRADGLTPQLDRRGVERRARHQPLGRLPHHPAGAAADAARALRPDRQRRLDRRPAGQRRPGQLRGLEGRADRDDARRSPSRSRAAGSPSTPSPRAWSRPSSPRG